MVPHPQDATVRRSRPPERTAAEQHIRWPLACQRRSTSTRCAAAGILLAFVPVPPLPAAGDITTEVYP